MLPKLVTFTHHYIYLLHYKNCYLNRLLLDITAFTYYMKQAFIFIRPCFILFQKNMIRTTMILGTIVQSTVILYYLNQRNTYWDRKRRWPLSKQTPYRRSAPRSKASPIHPLPWYQPCWCPDPDYGPLRIMIWLINTVKPFLSTPITIWLSPVIVGEVLKESNDTAITNTSNLFSLCTHATAISNVKTGLSLY